MCVNIYSIDFKLSSNIFINERNSVDLSTNHLGDLIIRDLTILFFDENGCKLNQSHIIFHRLDTA